MANTTTKNNHHVAAITVGNDTMSREQFIENATNWGYTDLLINEDIIDRIMLLCFEMAAAFRKANSL